MGSFGSKVSLSTRLFISGALISLVILVIAVAILSVLQRQNLIRGFDEQLKIHHIALLAVEPMIEEELASFPFGKPSENRFEVVSLPLADGRFVQPFSGWYWSVAETRVGGQSKRLISSSLLGEAFPTPRTFMSDEVEALVDFGTVDGPLGQHLRVLRHRQMDEEGQLERLTLIAGDITELEHTLTDLRQRLLVAVALISLAFAAVGTLQVRFGLRPLAVVSRNIGLIRGGKLAELDKNAAKELMPLTNEINALIEANRTLVERAQRNAGNLAHALKTPLSVIKNEARKSGSTSGESIYQQAEAMQVHIDYHLQRTRAQALAARQQSTTNIREVVEGLFRILHRLHGESHVGFVCTGDISRDFRGEKQDLEEMLGNILDNSAKWAKNQVVVHLEETVSESGGAQVCITVEDDGPGLRAQDRERALKPGERLDESKPGTGLGLTIVKDLAEAYEGSLTLGDAEIGGLKVCITLPARDRN